MENEKLYNLVSKAVNGDLKATFEIIIEFENIINDECYIDGQFNNECKDYIVDGLLKNIKKFKNI